MIPKNIFCFECGKKYNVNKIIFECDNCGGSLDIAYDYGKIKKYIMEEHFRRDEVKHWKYWMFYPIENLDKVISFNEGGTPLIDSRFKKSYKFKFEGVNPTGSFKDRGSSIEISKANELGIKKVVCASTGNMGASIAAYCARAGIESTIFLPDFVSEAKKKQILICGSKIVKVKGTYDDAVLKTKKLYREKHVYLTGDYPYRGEGEKSVGFEIIDQLNFEIPDYIVCPVGNATLIYATFKACNELKQVGLIKKLPKLVGVQAKGCSTVVRAFNSNSEIKIVKKPRTIATAISCGNPVDGLQALYGLKKSDGLAVDVSDREILDARKELGKEGIYAEPGGAVSYAGAKKLKLKGEVVCVVTGHGLKDYKY